MDRLSDHRFVANYFRLYLHALAMNLLVRLRRQVAEPLAVEPTGVEGVVPAEAQTGAERQRLFARDGSATRWGKGSRVPGDCC